MMSPKREQVETLWRDPANWTWGIIYHCRDDPRAIVPRRWTWGGWTLNFAHPRAGVVGLLAMAVAVVPGLLTVLLFRDRRVTLAAMALSVVALVWWAHRESRTTA